MKQGSNPSKNCYENFSMHKKKKIVFRFEIRVIKCFSNTL